jgi:hypothetical protein
MAARVLSSESAEADDVATAVLLDIGAELAALVGVSDRVRGRLVGPPRAPRPRSRRRAVGPKRLKASSLIEPTFDTLEHGHQ